VIVPVPAVAPSVTVPEFVPAVTTLTSPLLLHVPPEVLSVNVITVPAHADVAPCTGNGIALTVNITVAEAPPCV
jgi:hypothetical protein